MIQKSFSDGIFLEKEGPESSTIFRSTYNVIGEKSYVTGVYLVPKLVPKRTYYTMDGVLEKDISTIFNCSCSLSNGEESYENSVSVDQSPETIQNDLYDRSYYQSIELIPGLVLKDFTETIHVFPKEYSCLYKTSFMYDSCCTKRNYSVGLEVEKVREVIFPSKIGEESSFTSSMHVAALKDGGYCPVNGEYDFTDQETRI